MLVEELLKSKQDLLEQLFGRAPVPSSGIMEWMEEDIVYDVRIAENTHFSATFQGRKGVSEYFAIVRATYEVLVAGPLVLNAAGDQVLVQGSEIAYLIRREQIVRAEWMAVVELGPQGIARVSLSVHGWTVLASGAWTRHAFLARGSEALEGMSSKQPSALLGRSIRQRPTPLKN